jgi:glycerol-3-phosphate dehydrogenase
MYDVIIIGAGVIGCSVARELSKYSLKTGLIEKYEDVATGASKGNSGIVHGGYAAKHGTLKGKYCFRGNAMFDQMEKEMHIGYRKTGALVVAFSKEDEAALHSLYENGIAAGNRDLAILNYDAVKKIEPHISSNVTKALHCASVGVVSPYEYTIALAENAVHNRVELFLNHAVTNITRMNDYYKIFTPCGTFESRYVVNAAGLYSDVISGMVGDTSFNIIPRRGQYIVLGKDQGKLVKTVIFQTPTKLGKGILVSTTYHGNFLIGPDAIDQVLKEDTGTHIDEMIRIIKLARKSFPDFNLKSSLTTFAGVRPRSTHGDFIIEESKVAKGFINLGGIESPGITSSPAIAVKVSELLNNAGLKLDKNPDFDPYRKPVFHKKPDDFDGEINADMPEKHLICRCEKVSELEITDALTREIDISSVEAVKRRTRAGMGNCQGSFCGSRVKKIISQVKGIPVEEISIRGNNVPPKPERIDIKEIRKLDV